MVDTPKLFHGADHTSLRLEHRFPVRRSAETSGAVPGGPAWIIRESVEAFPGPIAEVNFNDIVKELQGQTGPRRNGFSRLPCPLKRACAYGHDVRVPQALGQAVRLSVPDWPKTDPGHPPAQNRPNAIMGGMANEEKGG